MKKLILLSALILSATFIFAQMPDVQAQLEKNGEVYFTFEAGSSKQLNELTRIISIDNVVGSTVYAYANADEFAAFEKLGYKFKLLPHPNADFNPVMLDAGQIKNADAWDFYPTYDAYVAMMQQFETDYPTLCDIDTIGYSVNNRMLLVARISDSVGVEENEPEFLYTSSIHGDELTGAILMLRLIDSLLTGYGSDPRVTNLVNNMDIYINPMANPDGTYNGGNNSVAGAVRYNANGYDLNRNFPDPVAGPNPNGPWQPETIAFMNFAESRHFVMAANFHGGFEIFNYPWDHKYALSADDDWWKYVGHEYADTAHAHAPSSYMNQYDDGIVNGATWYVVYGGRQDYMNFNHQCREVTIELSDTKLIPASQLPAHWEYNRRSLLNYMEQALYGIRGIVTDAATNQPLKAEVYVLNHEIDGDSSWVYSDLPVGNYHRMLNAGTYDVRFTSPCHKTKTFVNIDVQNYQASQLNVLLEPTTADFMTETPVVTVGQSISFLSTCLGPVSWKWTFEGAVPETSTDQNPTGVIYPNAGSYNVKLVTSDGNTADSVVKENYITVGNQILMNNGNIDAGYGLFYDSGGPDNNYSNYEDYILTMNPVQTNTSVKAEFLEFEVQSGYYCSSDYIEIYDGPTMGSPLIGRFCGTDNPGTIISTDAGGALTFVFHSNGYSNYSGWKALITNEAETAELNLTLLLEGAFDVSQMTTTLNDNGHIPILQPYESLGFYGTENVIAIPNANVVDWILVELRDAPDAASATTDTRLETIPAFVLKDGTVTGLDGSSMLKFGNSLINQLFVVIHHRNHLSIMSANALTESTVIYSYNFTDALSKAYQNGQKEIAPGIYGMAGGDSNADGIVDDSDKDLNWSLDAGNAGYFSSDLNLDGQVNNPDKTGVWFQNLNMEAQLPPEPAK